MAKPNLLGRALRYIVDAGQYAAGEETKAARRGAYSGMFATALDRQAAWGQYNVDDLTDTDANYQMAVRASWVYADIRLIAARVASHPWEVMERKGEELEEIKSHPFERLWSEPGGTYSGILLAQYSVWWYLLRGNAYLFLSTDGPGRGEPHEIWPMVANWVKPKPETVRRSLLTGLPIVDYEYSIPGTEPMMLPGENVVHFRTPNPWDYWQGLSPLVAARDGIALDIGARRWQRDWYHKNNAVPSAIINLPADMLETDFDFNVERMREDIAAGKRIHFVRSGTMTVATIQQTMADMQFVEARSFTREEIDNIFGVPTGLLSGGSSGDAQQAQEISFGRNTIQPLLDYMAAELTMKVGPYYGEDIVIAAPDVVPQDRALEIQEYTAYGTDRTVNENRAELGLDEWEMAPEAAEMLGLDVGVLANIPTRILALMGQASSSKIAETLGPGIAGDSAAQPGKQPLQIEGGEEPAQAPTAPGQQDAGSLPGAQAPGQAVETLAEKAAWLGIETEMGRWQKVALKEVAAGRNPAEREFASDIIPQGIAEGVREALLFAKTGEDVKAAFGPPFFRKGRPRDGGWAEGPQRGGEGQRRGTSGQDSAGESESPPGPDSGASRGSAGPDEAR